jgi:predicted DNA-binding protein YlxM (UPF0122 family)
MFFEKLILNIVKLYPIIMNEKPLNHYALWTEEDENQLVFLYNNDFMICEIANNLNRTEHSVRVKLQRIPSALKLPYIDCSTCDKAVNEISDSMYNLWGRSIKLRKTIEFHIDEIKKYKDNNKYKMNLTLI